MLKIWDHSALAMGGRDEEIDRVLAFERDVRQRMVGENGRGRRRAMNLSGGVLTMDSQVQPDWLDAE